MRESLFWVSLPHALSAHLQLLSDPPLACDVSTSIKTHELQRDMTVFFKSATGSVPLGGVSTVLTFLLTEVLLLHPAQRCCWGGESSMRRCIHAAPRQGWVQGLRV